MPKAPLMTMSPRSPAAEVTCCHWLPAPAVTEEPGMLKEQPCGRKPEVNQRWLLRLRVQIESEYGWTDLASSACNGKVSSTYLPKKSAPVLDVQPDVLTPRSRRRRSTSPALLAVTTYTGYPTVVHAPLLGMQL